MSSTPDLARQGSEFHDLGEGEGAVDAIAAFEPGPAAVSGVLFDFFVCIAAFFEGVAGYIFGHYLGDDFTVTEGRGRRV